MASVDAVDPEVLKVIEEKLEVPIEGLRPGELEGLFQQLLSLPEDIIQEYLQRYPDKHDPLEQYLQSLVEAPEPAEDAEADKARRISELQERLSDLLDVLQYNISEWNFEANGMDPVLKELLAEPQDFVPNPDAASQVAEDEPATSTTPPNPTSAHDDLRRAQQRLERRFLHMLSHPDPALAHTLADDLETLLQELKAQTEIVFGDEEQRRWLEQWIQEEWQRVPFRFGAEAKTRSKPAARAQPGAAAQPVREWMSRVEPPVAPAPSNAPAAASSTRTNHPDPPRKGAAATSATQPQGSPTASELAQNSTPETNSKTGSPQTKVGPPAAMNLARVSPESNSAEQLPVSPTRRPRKAARLPDSYTINTVVAMDEDDVQEFKDYGLGNNEGWTLMQDAVRRTVNSFLNRSGGRMFFGITDDGLVKGIGLAKRQRDMVRREVDKIINQMWPQVDIEAVNYFVKFVPVVDPQNTPMLDHTGSPVYVVVISVDQDPNLVEMGVYFTDKNCCNAFVRSSASCQRICWQLVQDRIRRANTYREGKGVPPINLMDSHYSRYRIGDILASQDQNDTAVRPAPMPTPKPAPLPVRVMGPQARTAYPPLRINNAPVVPPSLQRVTTRIAAKRPADAQAVPPPAKRMYPPSRVQALRPIVPVTSPMTSPVGGGGGSCTPSVPFGSAGGASENAPRRSSMQERQLEQFMRAQQQLGQK